MNDSPWIQSDFDLRCAAAECFPGAFANTACMWRSYYHTPDWLRQSVNNHRYVFDIHAPMKIDCGYFKTQPQFFFTIKDDQ